MATRQRLLDCTEALLTSTPYRDITVTDIARAANTSPATFYQYFLDIESAVIALAEVTGADGARLAELLKNRRWRGGEGWQNAATVVDGFLDFWQSHQHVLRVVDLLTEEGDERLRAVRVRMLNAVTRQVAEVIVAVRAASGREGADPMALAGALVSMLAHVSAHQNGFEAWDIGVASVRDAMADILYWGITGPKVPDHPRPAVKARRRRRTAQAGSK